MSNRQANPRTMPVEERTGENSDTEPSQLPPEYPVCPECEAAAFDEGTSHHELVCRGCGLVVDTHYVDHGPEWRAYTQAQYESRARTSATTTLRHDKGMGTVIDWRNRDGTDRTLSAAERRRAGRLRQWHQRVRTQRSGERTLRKILGELGRMASALGVPDSIQEVAGAICQRAETEGVVRGWSVEGIATSALYAACRQGGSPRSLDEVTAVSRVERREVGRTYKHLARELEIDLEPPHPQEYVARFCSDLDLPEPLVRDARTLLERAAEAGVLSGKSPTGYAGAAVFVVALVDERARSATAVADVAGVTRATIRTHAREQLELLGTGAIAKGLLGDGNPPVNWRERIELNRTANRANCACADD